MQKYKVGGAVRDHLLGHPITDTDWVVVGTTAEALQAQGFRPVGGDFPVFIHPHTGDEYALARTERKQGHGYAGFVFFAHPEVTLEQDLLRRDLTVNAMAQDEQGRIIDPYGGQQDLQQRLLRHVSPAFAEDPLRVLRVARYAARYAHLGFRIAPETLALMSQLAASGELQALTAERVWKEISRALMEKTPEVFIQTLQDCGALQVLLPEVAQLFGVPQRLDHHPEGDTGRHTLLTLQQCAHHAQPLEVRWACLLHDVGKGLTASKDWPRHIGHEERGRPLIKMINQRYRPPKDCQEVALLVGEWHLQVHRAPELRPATLLRLLQQLDALRRPERFQLILQACHMDSCGRLGREQMPYPSLEYLTTASAIARAVPIQPLLDRGLTGAALGQALQSARQRALGAFREQRKQAPH